MEVKELRLQEMLTVFEFSLSQIKWRLKSASKCRLQTDILALCAGMRPVVMVDYGGKMPELGDHLCKFLKHCKKESLIFELLHVMVIDDMIYLIQVRAFADFVNSSLNLDTEILFVDLENDPPKMTTQAEKSPAVQQLQSAQKLLSSVFHAGGVNTNQLQCQASCSGSSLDGHDTSASSELVDLSYLLQKSQVTIPTLNGWLLGYPVVYSFGKDCIEQSIYNLSTKSLNIYQIFVDRVGESSKGYQKEELMSFTVPYELSLEGSNEPWAMSFLAHMRERWDKCKHIWGSLYMEVSHDSCLGSTQFNAECTMFLELSGPRDT